MAPTTMRQTGLNRILGDAGTWLKENLLSPWYNAIITVISLAIVYVVLKGTIQWVLFGAKWGVVKENLRLFAVGPYPADQVWRVWLALAMAVLLGGISWRAWGGSMRAALVYLPVPILLVLVAPLSMEAKRNWLVVIALFPLGSALTYVRIPWAKILPWAWLGVFFTTIILLRGFRNSEAIPFVETGLWGGFTLTVLLAVVAIVVSFPIGVLLALGRRSRLPVVKMFSIAYIELIRGVPLVTILFMAQVMLPLFLPKELRIDKVLRAMVGMIMFSAAYMAENVRGGLQAIPKGQYEAAQALGLNYYQMMRYIILPQALRAVIPAIVGQFIGLFKDTSLVAIVGLLDLLYVALSVISQPEWIGRQAEVFLFIAVIYWVFCYAMSYASRRLEAKLGVGVR